MVRAVAFWQCIASAVTICPSRASSANSSGRASISLLSPATFCWPSTSRCSTAQALTRCSGRRPRWRSKLRLAVLPSTATTSPAPASWANAATKRPKLASKASGSSSRKSREKVSWLGMPPSRRRKRRRNGSLARPNRAMSTQPSAPHRVAASAISRISNRSWRWALPLRGSARSPKQARNRSMPPSSGKARRQHIKHMPNQKDSTNSICDSPGARGRLVDNSAPAFSLRSASIASSQPPPTLIDRSAPPRAGSRELHLHGLKATGMAPAWPSRRGAHRSPSRALVSGLASHRLCSGLPIAPICG